MCNIRKRRVNTSGEKRENLWEGGGNIYYIHIHIIYIYILKNEQSQCLP